MLLFLPALSTALHAAPPRAAILSEALPGADPATVRDLGDCLQHAGYITTSISAEALSDARAFSSAQFELLLLPHARSVPLSTIPAIKQFLEQGGRLIACAAPLWDSGVIDANGKWLTRADQQALLDAARPQRVLIDFENEDLTAWNRSSNVADPPARHEVTGAPQGRSLHVIIADLTSWDVLGRSLPRCFAPGHSITCFRARGTARTRQLAVEWTENDGSRWIATVNLTPEWRDYALPPDAFVSWQPPRGRGGGGDRLRVENVQRFSIGLALSHTNVERGPHEYWFAGLGTAPNPLGDIPGPCDIPHLEMLCPAYQTFAVSGAAAITDGQFRSVAPPSLTAFHPRPGASGYNKDRPWRWQPLLNAFSETGDFRGTIATLTIPLRKPYRGAAWASFTPADPAFYRQVPILRMVRDLARSLRRGVFLQEGGAQFYTVFDGQPVSLGAGIVRLSGAASGDMAVRIAVIGTDAKSPVYERTWPLRLENGHTGNISDTCKPTAWPASGYTVVTELLEGNEIIDRVSHELHVYRPKPNPRFITVRDGGFFLDDRPWKAHGVNYMPSSGIALADGALFEHWIGAAAYDGAIIDRDLRRIKAMNLNSVSVFLYHQLLPAQNMLDFLRRCESLGLRVNLSLRPGTPMDFRWGEVREMIEGLGLAGNDTVFAYDLAWEPSHYNEAHQKRYVPAWRSWVERRYGSVGLAEKAWSHAAPRENGELSIPPANQLVNDGPWRKVVADYRGFLDDLLRQRYSEARRLVKSIDPNHAVSFRMQLAGDPTWRGEDLLPYDFVGLADAVDVWEPEAYGRIGDWERVKPGHFTTAYARLCDPSKPLVWAEMGCSVWDGGSMAADPGKLDFQASFHRDFYRMMIESGADGVFHWWYAGGYRLNERSDFGIVNPDGTDRPVTRVIRDQAASFLSAAKPAGPTVIIPIDRDRDARGLYGIYESVQREYWQALESGGTPALRWEHRPGFSAQPAVPNADPPVR